MHTDFIRFNEYRALVETAIGEYIAKLHLQFSSDKEYGVELRNEIIHVSISFRYREFELIISNGKSEIGLNDLIFKKYPNYIELIKSHPEKSIFNNTDSGRKDIKDDFIYCLKKSFEFIEENFKQVFVGVF